MQGKRGGGNGGGKRHPIYIGVFAKHAKDAHKTVRSECKEVLLDILKQFNPQAYLPEGQKQQESPQVYEQQRLPTEEEVVQVEKDLSNFEAFNSPQDNYHVTCLFIGHKAEKLSKKQQLLYRNWKEGVEQPIRADFIVYVPNYIMAAYTPQLGDLEVDNEHPHMTLLIKQGTSAVESNALLESLAQKLPQILKERQKYITALHIPFKGSQVVFVIDRKFELEGHCGNNFHHGKADK